MRPIQCVPLAFILLFVGFDNLADASLGRVLRQSGENEQEATTAKSQPAATGVATLHQPQQANRLYPDIPQQPNFLPPFAGVGPNNYPAVSHHHGQTPFVPFGIQIPASRLNADQQPAPFGRVLSRPQPMSPAERLQSQSFANGLGRRLLSIVGIDTNASNEANGTTQNNPGLADEALRNSTVLQQLNKGLNSIYAGLSRVYNSTVQQQLNLLQDKFKSETENSTNPWHRRMAEQVPQFFKQMALRVEGAQEQLNRVVQDVMQAAQGNTSVLARAGSGQSRSFFGPFEQLVGDPSGPGDFFNNVGRSLGLGNGQLPAPQAMAQSNSPQGASANAGQTRDLTSQLREFWHSQVQPQIGMVRNQVSRVWRDLTTSGAFRPEMVMRSRAPIQGQSSAQNESGSDLIDDILKEIDMSGSEYSLIEAKQEPAGEATSKQQASGSDNTASKLSPQMQNRLIGMQRELNQLWTGLTSSIQSAIKNVRNTVNPPVAQFAPNLDALANSNKDATDPRMNEIEGKVKNLSKLQRDADMLHDTLEQQQREAQQRNNIGDRFKNFFNNVNVDLSGVNQLPDRIGQSFNRFGVVVGDLWNQIPERWDNLVQNMRPQHGQQQADIMAKMKSPTSTENPKPER